MVTHVRPDSPEGLRAALRDSAADVATALATAQRGALFYEADHPVVQQQRRELEAAVRVWQVNAGNEAIAHSAGAGIGGVGGVAPAYGAPGGTGFTLIAAAGDALLLTGLEDGVVNDAARVLCTAMIGKSVVGFRLKSPAPTKELAELVAILAEHDKRIRAAGGVAQVLAERGVRSIEAVVMDLDQMLNGATLDPAGLDPLIAKALTATLALKKRDARKGSAVSLTLERVDNPASLGSLLDDLIDGAAPGVADVADPKAATKSERTKPAAHTGPLHGASADDLADLAASAYGKVAGGNTSVEALTESAKVLSSALVRLSPMARFKLLQKIASAKDSAGAEAVGREVANPMLMSALAQVVMGGERDSKLATAIGSLLERMRPLERDRQRLIDELDDKARAGGRPLDALFLQELNESSQKTTFGALDLPFRETREGLAREALVRQTTRGQPELIAQTFASLRPESRVVRTARLIVAMLDQERTVAPATLATVRSVLTLAATDPALGDINGDVIHALWNRALRDGPMSSAAQQLADLARSPHGAGWSVALLDQLKSLRGADTAALLFEFLRGVLAVHDGESFRRRLVDALHNLDRSVVRVLERRVGELPAAGVQTLIARAARESSASALGVAQTALRAANLDVKEAALRALAPVADDAVILLLRRASGLDGPALCAQVLSAQKEGEAALTRLQRAAIESLGATRAVAAVPLLNELMTRTRLVGGADFDKVRTFAARALGVNNTREARIALDEGKISKVRAVRIACGGKA